MKHASLFRKSLSASAAGAVTLATLAIPTAPPVIAADSQPTSLSQAYADIDANLQHLQQQSAELNSQSAAVAAQIADLENQRAALIPKIEEDQQRLKDAIRDSYVAGVHSTLEVVASNRTFSNVVDQQHYQVQLSQKTQEAAKALEASKKELDDKIASEHDKQAGLATLQSQLNDQIATAQAQAEARRQLEIATQNREAEYQRLLAAQQAQEAAATVSQATAKPSPRGGGGSVFSGSGSNPFPWGQCTWYVASVRGGWQYGNAGTWTPNSSVPGVGKIVIMRAFQGGAGAAGHVGIVVGVSGNSVTIRDSNWAGLGVITTHTIQNTGLYIN